jgi:hypothetical protein
MAAPTLTNDERTALEHLVAFGPERELDRPLRGRLALYRLIDETPEGWKITPLGREALAAVRPRRESGADDAAAAPDASTRPDGERRYGRKSRDTSWLE